MNRSLSGIIGALAVATLVGSCKEDPTASNAGGARTIIANPNPVVASVGANGSFLAAVYDALLNPVPATFTATSSDPTVATVVLDPVNPDPNGTRQRFTVTGLKPGRSLIQVAQASGGNLSVVDTANIAPIVFDGTISNLTPAGGSTITITSTSLLKFSSSPVVTFGNGVVGAVANKTADLLTVIAPFADAGRLKIDSIAPTYIATNQYSLNTVGTVTQTGDFWIGDSSATTAPTLALPASDGAKLPMITNLFERDNKAICPDAAVTGFQGPCMFYQFTLADTMTIKFLLDWDGTPAELTDLDIFACTAATVQTASCGTTPESGTAGKQKSTTTVAKKPESFFFTFPAGTHFLVIERRTTFNPTGTTPPRNLRVTITRRP